MYIAYSYAYMTHPGCAALCSGAADFMKAPGNFDLYNLQGASHQGQTGSDPEHISVKLGSSFLGNSIEIPPRYLNIQKYHSQSFSSS